MSSKSLYICYFGVREPLVQTQVIPYIREITKGGVEMSLLTFEPKREAEDIAELSAIKERLAAEGIALHWLAYHKRFSALATTWDILAGSLFIRKFIERNLPDVLHGRVHVPTLMGALARKFSRHKPKLLFDIRGFFPEEYTDAGIWPEGGLLYRTAKRMEAWLLDQADGFVVLTARAREILFPEAAKDGFDKRGRPVEVIPCCVDLSRFAGANETSRTEMRREMALEDRFVAAYVGAFGGWYLTEETADFFGAVKAGHPDAFAMVLTQSRPEMIEPLLRSAGYAEGDYLIRKVPPSEIPRYLSAADMAVSFIKECYSKQASSPTKNAEYLACGLPIVANAGVGDVEGLVEGRGVGAIVHDLTCEAYAAALQRVSGLNGVAEHCRRVAEEEFDLERVGGERYRRIYSRLLNR